MNAESDILELLTEVCDPEIPSLNVVEMGIVRKAVFDEDTLVVTITPTYSGCPAMQTIEDDIVATLGRHGYQQVRVESVLSPAWTTDWLTEEAKEKLKREGIAPPGPVEHDVLVPFPTIKKVACPYCDSVNTERRSEFGSTACKAIHYCNSCEQPFDHFKSF